MMKKTPSCPTFPFLGSLFVAFRFLSDGGLLIQTGKGKDDLKFEMKDERIGDKHTQ